MNNSKWMVGSDPEHPKLEKKNFLGKKAPGRGLNFNREKFSRLEKQIAFHEKSYAIL